MTDVSELTHAGWQELRQGPIVGWDQATMNSLDIMYAVGETDGDQEARRVKIEHVGSFIRKVVSMPLEPVVFYRPGYTERVANDQIHFFHVVTPDPEAPVEFMAPTDASDLGAVLRLKSFGKDIGKIAKHTVHADFDTTVNTELDSNVKVWFGIGAQSKTVSPDQAYDYRDLGVQAAIGSQEAGELFSSLRTDDTVRNGRLFGAMFDIAWMAHDLDIKPTNLGEFSDEKTAALEATHVKRSAASALVHSSTKIFELLQEAAVKDVARNEVISAARNMYTESIGDVFIRDLYDNREIYEEVSSVNSYASRNISGSVENQQKSIQRIRQAINAYDKQLAILNSIVN